MVVLPPALPDVASVIAAEARREMVSADVDVERLVLDVVKKGVRSFNTTNSILDARIRETMTGSPTLTVTIHDPERRLLKSEVLYYVDKDGDRRVRPINVEVDEHPFRLVNVKWGAASTGSGVDITLVFEHLLVALLRRHDSAKKISRKKVTLVEFISTFAREVKTMPIRFVSKELHKKLPIAGLSKDEKKRMGDANRDPGLGDKASVEVKGVKATKQQRHIIESVLQSGDRKNVERRGLVIAIMVVTQESGAGVKNRNPTNPGVIGPFQQDSGYGTPEQRMDIDHAADKFFDRLKKVLKAHPRGYSYGELADKVQISGNPAGYQQWKDEAEHTVKEYAGTGSESGTDTRTRVKQYNYTRGVDGKKENSWDCSQRYASLVNFRSFVVGRSTWIFESEPVLFRSRSRMTISRDDPAVIDITGDVDEGKKAQTLSARVLIRRWVAPPGSVVTVEGEGVGDGRWLVEDIERSLYSTEADITLKKPTKPKPEPAPETETFSIHKGDGSSSASSDSSGHLDTIADDTGAVARLYTACKHISDADLPYVYGGGHGQSLSAMRLGHIAIVNVGHTRGLDCSSSTSLALLRAGLFGARDTALVSGEFMGWGKPGRGKFFTVWWNADHVWIEGYDEHGRPLWRFDTSPHGDGGRGPHLRSTARSTGGFAPRHWPGL